MANQGMRGNTKSIDQANGDPSLVTATQVTDLKRAMDTMEQDSIPLEKEIAPTLGLILQQLQIMNFHLELISGEKLSSGDI